MAARKLPDPGKFSISLANLIANAERQLSSASYQTRIFASAPEYERTPSSLQPRVGEINGSLPALQNVVTDFTYLSNRVSFLRSHS